MPVAGSSLAAGAVLVAAFGVPLADDDHAGRTLRVALKLAGGERVRIGVDTGEVLVSGAPGSRLLIVGDAVQLALALAHAAAPGEVLVGQRCRALATEGFVWDGRRLVAAAVGAPRAPGRFVGRAAELERLGDALTRVRAERRPRLVVVVGEAGVGKSALVRALAASTDVAVRTGRCLRFASGATYWPLGELLRAELGLDESAAATVVAERLGEHAAVAAMVGADVLGDLHPAAARERIHGTWVEWLSEVVAHDAMVLVVEDLHWAHDDLLDLVERTILETTGPLLVIATARPELLARRPGFGMRARDTAIMRVQALGDADTLRLIDALLDGAAGDELSQLVLARAEGNPFFVEETIAVLVEGGAVQRTDTGWRVDRREAGLAVADTIHAALASRIDLLPPDAKQVLRAAAVAGRRFPARAIEVLVPGAHVVLPLLVRREFLRPEPATLDAGARFAFKHALTRDVAYDGLTKARRSELHLHYARWLEQEHGDDDAPFLAHHYSEAAALADADVIWPGRAAEHARVRRLAASWLEQAARMAYRRGAVQERANLLEQAVEMQPDAAGQTGALRSLAHAYAVLYDGEGFQRALEQAAELTDDPAVRGELIADLAYESHFRPTLWQRAPDAALVGRWVEEALALNQETTAGRVRALAARVWQTPRRASRPPPRQWRSPRSSTATHSGAPRSSSRPRSPSPRTGHRRDTPGAAGCSRSGTPSTIPTTGAGSRGTRRSPPPPRGDSPRPTATCGPTTRSSPG